ncbi:MAG: hypothetical protein MUO76_16400 [Anaerolineaceae bacterium]|nr:hypothetical protein [Anaerolineaceae bacterium]
MKLISFLDAADWGEEKKELLTDEILTGWVSQTADGIYTWIDSEDSVTQVALVFKDFKDRVNSPHGVKAVVIAYDKLEPCNGEQILEFEERFAAAPSGKDVLFNLCRFPDPYYEDQFSDYVELLEQVVNNLPDEFSLTEALEGSEDDPQGVGSENIKTQFRLIHTLMNIAWLIPLIMVHLNVAVKVSSIPSLGRWRWIPVLISGLLTLLPPLFFPAVITNWLAEGPLSEPPSLSEPRPSARS